MEMECVHEHKRGSITDFSKLSIDRSATVNGLLRVFENSPGPLSIQLNAAYGTGKSTFFDHLETEVDKEKFIVIYYNAWEEEVSLDARSSLCLAILNEIEENSAEKKSNAKIASFQKAILPIIAKAGISALSRFLLGDHKALLEAFDAAAIGNTIADAIRGGFKEAEQSRFQIHQIKEALRELIADLGDKKILILIDELDRYRPDFAIEVLETVKHFFSIDGVFSLIGIDENLLHSIVRKRYGSSIDCDGYLLRHFSSVISFQNFAYDSFCNDRCKAFGLPRAIASYMDFFSNVYRLSLRDVSTIISTLGGYYNNIVNPDENEFCKFSICFIIRKVDGKFFDACLSIDRSEYFYSTLKKMRNVRIQKNHGFEMLIHIVQSSQQEYEYLSQQYNCRMFPENEINKVSGRAGFNYFAQWVSDFESLSFIE